MDSLDLIPRILSRFHVSFLRNKSSKDMAFPHPQSRNDHYRKEDKPSSGGIVWKFFKRTINITKYWNAEDDVNPAKNRTFGGLFHDEFVLHLSTTPRHLLWLGLS